MLETFRLGTFRPRIGEAFRISTEPAVWCNATLIEASALGEETVDSTGSSDRRAPFSIVFRGPAAPVLPQRIYQVEHEAMGVFDLFLVPIGPDQEGMRYEAIFT